MNKTFKIVLFGFLSWLIPFAVSFFFYAEDGNLSVDIFLFKTIMIIIGAVTGVYLLALFFKKLEKDYLKEGIIVGLVWFLINIGLDIVILIPMSGMAMGNYFMEIGLRYLVIPIMAVGMGYVLNGNHNSHQSAEKTLT